MRQTRLQSFATSPVMVGSLTVLITILAVFLAYNANNGLPFVPSYRLTAQVPNAAQLVPGNEVRIGGVRVGVVEAVDPVSDEQGDVRAELTLRLDEQVRPIPTDSTIVVRTRSALGLKYLEIKEGESEEGFPEASVIPISSARPEPVEINEVFDMFDIPTREAIRVNQVEFGGALAGRGFALNETLGQLPGVLERLIPVGRNLASEDTGLARFVRALAAAAAEAAPVADIQADMFANLDTTFAAFARIARPYLQETISRTPETLDVTIATLPRVRPFLDRSGKLFAELRPGAVALADTAPTLASAFETGAPVLRDSPVLNRQLEPTAQALLDFQRNPDVQSGIAELTDVNEPLGELLRFVTPAQSVCNYATILFRNTASMLSGNRNAGATGQRFIVFDTPYGPNSEGTPSSAPADGGGDRANFLHVNPYPNTASPGQTHECEAGNEPFLVGETVIGNVPGNQGTSTSGQLGGGD